MAFTPFEGGGRGLAEQFSGLPIDMRRVSCPVARGSTAGMNLDWLASDFYDQHCVGCQRRRPTGEIPSLASVMQARKAEAAAAAEAERQATTRQHREWEQRAERRRAVAAGADPAMASALGDMAVTDHEPGRPVDRAAVRDALGRLTALADRAPGTFTSAVVDLAVQLVEHAGATSLVGPLRHLARHRANFRPVVLSAALSAAPRRPGGGGRPVHRRPQRFAGWRKPGPGRDLVTDRPGRGAGGRPAVPSARRERGPGSERTSRCR